MKTHLVLDLHHHKDEGQECFAGTLTECEEFVVEQSPAFMYKIVHMTDQELKTHNKTEHQQWWDGLGGLSKTRICDTHPKIVGRVRRWETLTDAEIRMLYEYTHQNV